MPPFRPARSDGRWTPPEEAIPEAAFTEEPVEPIQAIEPTEPIEPAPPVLAFEEPVVAPEEGEEAASEFPLDAFFIPEGVERVPSGVEAPTAEPEPAPPVAAPSAVEQAPVARVSPAATLAERLEHFARLLRENGPAALPGAVTGGDRLDALLAGLLTGYLVANDE